MLAKHSEQDVYRYVKEKPRISYVQPEDPWINRQLMSKLELMFGRSKIENVYHRLKEEPFDIVRFFESALYEGNIKPDYDQASLNAIPKQGPLVFVANHPFGIVDGVVMCDIAAKTRGDFRVMLHALLCQDRELAPYFIPIDFTNSKEALRNNIHAKRRALSDLAKGIPIIIFPSGMVSTANKFGFGPVNEAPWTTFAAKLIREAQATVVPVHFEGRNSRLFHVASHIAEPLRMALLVREALKKFNKVLDVTIGSPLHWEQMQDLDGRRALTDFLYATVQHLGKRS